MGMAAGQARLLSITSRMSDNELRAQIINNNKMRLAAESSQASEAYVAALNEAQLMFTNYDIDNNATYQNLTYNALTSFNPYNNQYALINSSGNVLLSEKDAENYRKSGGNLDAFLGMYGLDYTTTYFDQLPENVEFEGFEGLTVGRDILEYIYSGNVPEGTEFDLGKIGKINLHPTGSSAISYIGTANSEAVYDYDKYLQQYTETKNKYLGYIMQVMKEEFKTLVKDGDFKDSEGKALDSITDIKTYINSVIAEADAEESTARTSTSKFETNVVDALSKLITNMNAEKYTKNSESATNFFIDIENLIKNNAGSIAKDEFTSDNYRYMTSDGNDLYIVTKDETNPVIELKVDNKGNLYSISETETTGENGQTNYTSSGYNDSVFSEGVTPKVSSGDKEGWSKNPWVSPAVFSTAEEDTVNIDGMILHQVKNKEVDFSLYTINDIDNMAGIAKQVIATIESSLDTCWDSTAKYWSDGAEDSALKAAYVAYQDAAKSLSETIFGKDVPEKYDDLDDIYSLYNNYNFSELPFSVDFKKVFVNIIMDQLLDTYGEPNYAWIDQSSLPTSTSSYNTNGQAKAQWYENLFNRIKSGGYQVLQDGLASSKEWIQFAFESGIVTMEQIDSLGNWQPLIYSNCSDITSQTNEKMIAKAEAEYRNAMNKIENKDKRYDLELKNIDTEHNSLMAEYESIKTAIDKNVERTFKLYS